jgi:hypothetical protein
MIDVNPLSQSLSVHDLSNLDVCVNVEKRNIAKSEAPSSPLKPIRAEAVHGTELRKLQRIQITSLPVSH